MISNKSALSAFSPIHNHITDFFQIELDTEPLSGNREPHTDSFHQILYCHSNCGAEILVGMNKFPLQRGDVILIPSGTPHTWLVRSRAGEPYVGYRLCLDADRMDTLEMYLPAFPFPNDMQNCNLIRTSGTLWEPLGDMFHVLYQELHMKSPGWETAAMSCSLLLLTQIRRALVSTSQFKTNDDGSKLVEQILNYVHSHYKDKITLDDVAQKFWVSPSTVTHLFSKTMGTSFYKYVTRIRLAEAKNLIGEGMPMEKVALNVGFTDYSSFYRAFKKEFNISPKQYLQTSVQ